MIKQAQTIEEVIVFLDEIISAEIQHESALVFFPILYREVTQKVKEGIENEAFQDNARMERLDVLFANRYLEAYFRFKNGEKPTASWEEAFKAATDHRLLILQHLLLGMNAHINLDLGIAVSETAINAKLHQLLDDYHQINDILASMVDKVQQKINRVSPLFSFLDQIAKGREDLIASFSIEIARDEAWRFALKYHEAADKTKCIADRDRSIARIAKGLIHTKSRWLRWVLKVIRWFERKNVAQIAEALAS